MSLLFFYGTECPHCERLEKNIRAFESETGAKVERIEVWHDKANLARLEMIDKDMCGGVPFLYNEETKKFICGEAKVKEIKAWAL